MFSQRLERAAKRLTEGQIADLPDGKPVPAHVAIIMDGNGRWASERYLPRVAGHKKGADTVRSCVRSCGELGISYLTLYAFSSENWKRPLDEVDDLMGLLKIYLKSELEAFHKNNIRFRSIGDRSRLSTDIVKLIEDAERKTENNSGLTLILALNYGAQAEIAAAVRQIATKVAKGELAAEDITEVTVAAHLQTAGIPDPDIIIRTSGEQRLSNFLLWQAAYSELLFVDEFWPDFNKDILVRALEEYGCRERRFGARP
ncbi:isoprenyl transferase [Govanella unica]|uniref:Isoprenyl transferase n=1 Tax=Govanella unica TaxID=2975056 RepID=A0A9X3Z717_9PROT|nr:isoprenyl transferase [Govania unica]MDA5193770.1 isoprenyl transferase [Govania unica]